MRWRGSVCVVFMVLVACIFPTITMGKWGECACRVRRPSAFGGLLRLRGGREEGRGRGGGEGSEEGGGVGDKRSRSKEEGLEGRAKKRREAGGEGALVEGRGKERVGEVHEEEERTKILKKATGGGKGISKGGDMIEAVEQLHRALGRNDKKAQMTILDKVARIAHKKHAEGIYKVMPLQTGGMALGQSGKQLALRKSQTALARNEVKYDGKGKTLDEMREASKALMIPNPTDEALGIDELTELRMALAAANETRSVPQTPPPLGSLHASSLPS